MNGSDDKRRDTRELAARPRVRKLAPYSKVDSSTCGSYINNYFDDRDCERILNLWYSYRVIGFIVIWIVFNNDVHANVNRFHRFYRFVALQTFRTFINLADSTY